ncbi:S-layer homology domain-containing protein [Bacillus solimangrovi]|uniref:SLH domain-containing protein n=1 Tax=Bacillus solimangrovi TaxID=1305675 RepID=A0A1E5LDH5_9BACI|nr:S-layer homology domain-containing protein [Bacillus solimangrovi]OEH92133.1 hypothetical protein BFG57_02345 [Bacillus solimangrovi]
MKKNNKYFVATATTAALVASAVSPTAGVQAASMFNDVKQGSYYESAINDLVSKGIIKGYEDGTFKPNVAITRAEIAKVLANDLDLDLSVNSNKFKDVSADAWYSSAVNALANANIISGYEDGTFKPTENVTRAELASMLVRAYNISGNGNTPFADVKEGSWYADAVAALYNNSLTSGRTADSYAPGESVTRGEVAVFVNRMNVFVENAKTSVVEAINAETVVIDGVTYSVSENVKGILSAANAKVLENAGIEFEEVDGVINKITYLSVNASGQPSEEEFSGNLVLDGQDAVIEGQLVVNNDYITIKNVTVEGNFKITEGLENDFYSDNLTISGTTVINGGDDNTVVFNNSKLADVEINKVNVRVEPRGKTSVVEITLNSDAVVAADKGVVIPKVTISEGAVHVDINGTVETVEVNNNDEIVLKGNVNIKELKVTTGTSLSLESKGSIDKVEVESGTKLTLGKQTKVADLKLPEGSKAEDVIENYDKVNDQIKKIDGKTNKDATSGGSSGGSGGSGGGSSTSDKDAPELGVVTTTLGSGSLEADLSGKTGSEITITSNVEFQLEDGKLVVVDDGTIGEKELVTLTSSEKLDDVTVTYGDHDPVTVDFDGEINAYISTDSEISVPLPPMFRDKNREEITLGDVDLTSGTFTAVVTDKNLDKNDVEVRVSEKPDDSILPNVVGHMSYQGSGKWEFVLDEQIADGTYEVLRGEYIFKAEFKDTKGNKLTLELAFDIAAPQK